MKTIGKNKFKSMIINNEKLTIVENNFTWIDSLANYGTGFCYGSILNDNVILFLITFVNLLIVMKISFGQKYIEFL